MTETDGAKFEIQIKIFFVPEANEKPITLFTISSCIPGWRQSQQYSPNSHHHLRSLRRFRRQDTSAPTTATDAAEATPTVTTETSAESTKEQSETTEMDVDPSAVPTAPRRACSPRRRWIWHCDHGACSAQTGASARGALWQYDEIVFPEPMEAFYDILSTHPPTQLAVTSALAFADPAATARTSMR